MNQCHFQGRLTRDPQLKELGDQKKVVSFGLAINRPFKRGSETVKETVFIECEAWDSGAELIAKYFKKGKPILVDASVRMNEWTDKETNQKRSNLKFRVNKFYFVESDKQANAGGEAAPGPNDVPAQAVDADPVGDDGNIPF
jgi:single-strand DNA-binding protein